MEDDALDNNVLIEFSEQYNINFVNPSLISEKPYSFIKFVGNKYIFLFNDDSLTVYLNEKNNWIERPKIDLDFGVKIEDAEMADNFTLIIYGFDENKTIVKAYKFRKHNNNYLLKIWSDQIEYNAKIEYLSFCPNLKDIIFITEERILYIERLEKAQRKNEKKK